MWRRQSSRVFLGSVCLALYWCACSGAVSNGGNNISERIQRGESFLTNLFDTRLRLLPEYRGSSTYWLFHDNYLAAHLLSMTRPDLSRQIRSTLESFGVTRSGKIEIVFGEVLEPLPFRGLRFDQCCIARRQGYSDGTCNHEHPVGVGGVC